MVRAGRPDGLPEIEWRQMVMDARRTIQNWGADFVAFGWTTLQVFGVNRDPRHRRLDVLGLVYLLRGRPIEAIDADTALIRSARGDTTTFYRRLVAPGGVAAWDWAAL